MFGLSVFLYALFCLGYVSAARDYEYNVATNCREYPRIGVTDPVTCSQVSQVEDSLYNPLGTAGLSCPAPWKGPFRGSCYLFANPTTPALTADLAEADCQQRGGNLANINDGAEASFIRDNSAVGVDSLIANSPADTIAWNPLPWANRQPNTQTAGLTRIVAGPDGWSTSDPATATPYICEKKNIVQNGPGLCRWDAYAANINIQEACMCPATEATCGERGQCYWYMDPNSPFKECISQSERFYNMLHRLLIRRGKKDFAIKIRYGATPARGKLPLGPWGPAIIGHGHRQSMMGHPMGGMGGGMMGHPSRGIGGGMMGHPMGGMGGGMMGHPMGGMGGGMFGRPMHGYGGMMGGMSNYGRRWY